jgi:hypothetical protein
MEENINEVMDYITSQLKPKDKERHLYGEVFTPLGLINEMLDTLPNDVWNNETLKWLDPANGIGNFPITIFVRLYNGFTTKDGGYNPGLKNVITNDDDRCNHIINNMLYMVELNKNNIETSKGLFKKLAPNIEPNIIQMDKTDGFLADVDMIFPNGIVNEFDIIVGNPPYNNGVIRSASATNKTKQKLKDLGIENNKHKDIWIKFVKKILCFHLKKDAFLLFINPLNWFKPGRTHIHTDMLKYQIHNIRIYNIYQSEKLFSGFGKINTAYYLLQNAPSYTTTRIIDIYGNIDIVKLNSKSIIILAANSIFFKIQEKLSLIYEGDSYKRLSLDIKKCNGGDNKQLHKISQSGNISFVKTDRLHPDYNKSKIFLSGFNYPRYYYDKVGEYGIIGCEQHYFIGDKLNKLCDYFNTKLSCLLLINTKFRQEYIEPKYYPDVRLLPIETINDDTLADYFGFSKEERDMINCIKYPNREYRIREVSYLELVR